MADVLRTKVQGLRELGEAMRKLNAEVSTKIARGMCNAGAQVVKKDAVERAPQHPEPHVLVVDGDPVTIQPGNLKKNIVVKRLSKTNLTAEYLVTVRGKKKDGYAARYGRLVEFGTVKMPAEPYLRPALEQNVTSATNAMKNYGQKRIEKEARKAAGVKKK